MHAGIKQIAKAHTQAIALPGGTKVVEVGCLMLRLLQKCAQRDIGTTVMQRVWKPDTKRVWSHLHIRIPV